MSTTTPIPVPGYVYIYVNNNSSSSTAVFFDDLKVTQLHSPYVAGGDYYPFGLAMDDRQIKVEPYRFGYQGQYAEKDTLANWNAFQLRMYEPRFGRWLMVDPAGEYASSYVRVGNNPISDVDPTGGSTLPVRVTPEIFKNLTLTGVWDVNLQLFFGARLIGALDDLTLYATRLNFFRFPLTSAELAQKIINSGRVTFDKIHESGVVDGADAFSNIHDTSEGKKAKRSAYGNAPGGSVYLKPEMLKAVSKLSEEYEINVSEFAGGSHSAGSSHYSGNTVDISLINKKIANIHNLPDIDNLIQDANKLGLKFSLKPPAAGHATHIHLKF